MIFWKPCEIIYFHNKSSFKYFLIQPTTQGLHLNNLRLTGFYWNQKLTFIEFTVLSQVLTFENILVIVMRCPIVSLRQPLRKSLRIATVLQASIMREEKMLWRWVFLVVKTLQCFIVCFRLMKFVPELSSLAQTKYWTEWDNSTRKEMLNKICRQWQSKDPDKTNLKPTKGFLLPFAFVCTLNLPRQDDPNLIMFRWWTQWTMLLRSVSATVRTKWMICSSPRAVIRTGKHSKTGRSSVFWGENC